MHYLVCNYILSSQGQWAELTYIVFFPQVNQCSLILRGYDLVQKGDFSLGGLSALWWTSLWLMWGPSQPLPFPLGSFVQPPHALPPVPVQKWTLLTKQHAKLSFTQEDIMTNSSNVGSGKRTSALLFGLGNERSATFGAAQGCLFSLFGQATAWNWAGVACLCLWCQNLWFYKISGFQRTHRSPCGGSERDFPPRVRPERKRIIF